jgi:hypothetical protein
MARAAFSESVPVGGSLAQVDEPPAPSIQVGWARRPLEFKLGALRLVIPQMKRRGANWPGRSYSTNPHGQQQLRRRR